MNRHYLSAILFSDIVGYSRMMSLNEEITINLIRKNRKLHKTLIKKYNGKWCKEMGDGTLATFKTPSEAVYCAGELLKSCARENIVIRIGIHLGEIVTDNGDIFGDAVNLASRLESVAYPGQIIISQAVNRSIKNKPGICSRYLTNKNLKNIDEPIRIYRVSINDAQNFSPRDHRGGNDRIRRIMLTVAATIILLISSIYSDSYVLSSSDPLYEISYQI